MIAQLEAMLRDPDRRVSMNITERKYLHELRHTNLQRPGFDDSVVL